MQNHIKFFQIYKTNGSSLKILIRTMSLIWNFLPLQFIILKKKVKYYKGFLKSTFATFWHISECSFQIILNDEVNQKIKGKIFYKEMSKLVFWTKFLKGAEYRSVFQNYNNNEKMIAFLKKHNTNNKQLFYFFSAWNIYS